MATPTIAALRAASSNFASGPSGPQALNYAWMNTPGRALVMPVRSSPPPPRQSRPPGPTSGISVNDFRKATEPPLPPAGREGRVTNDTPGFVDGVTLPRDYNPTWNFNPNLLEDLMPSNFDAPMYSMPPPNPDVGGQPSASVDVPVVDMNLGLIEYLNPQFAEMAEPADQVQPLPEVPVSSSQMAAEPQFADFQLQEFIQPVTEAPVPAMPSVEPEAPTPAPVLQPSVPQESMDDMLMRYFMMQGMVEP